MNSFVRTRRAGANPHAGAYHGQPASPTRMGKEIRVFVERLRRQDGPDRDDSLCGQVRRCTGNFNAHVAAYPEIDWVVFANRFIDRTLGLTRLQVTTQIGTTTTWPFLETCGAFNYHSSSDLDPGTPGLISPWAIFKPGKFRPRWKLGSFGQCPKRIHPIRIFGKKSRKGKPGGLSPKAEFLEHLGPG